MPAKGERLLDDTARRELYLSKIREGHGRVESADLVGINYATIWRYLQEHPEFLERVRDAEAEQVEPVFKFLREVMDDESNSMRDRMKAADTLAKYRARDRQKDHQVIEHKHTVELTGGDQKERVLELQRKLEERRQIESGVIEAEVIEDDSDS